MNYSLTYSGIIIAVLVPVLAQVGFTQACANELVTIALPLVGGVIAVIGRYRLGGVDKLGRKR